MPMVMRRLYGVCVGIKEEFEQYVHNADLGPYISDKSDQHLILTESFSKDLNSIPVSLGCHLNCMKIHLPFL